MDVTGITRWCSRRHIARNRRWVCWVLWGGGETEGSMVSQDYLFAVLFVMVAMWMVHWGMNQTWKH